MVDNYKHLNTYLILGLYLPSHQLQVKVLNSQMALVLSQGLSRLSLHSSSYAYDLHGKWTLESPQAVFVTVGLKAGSVYSVQARLHLRSDPHLQMASASQWIAQKGHPLSTKVCIRCQKAESILNIHPKCNIPGNLNSVARLKSE